VKVSVVLPFILLGLLISASAAQAGEDGASSITIPKTKKEITLSGERIEDKPDLVSIIGSLESEVKKANALIEEQAKKVGELTAKVEPLAGASVNGVTNYMEWVAIILTALGVMIAVFTVGLSILAFIGYRDIKANAAKRAEDEVKKQLADGGDLRPFIEQTLLNTAERLSYPSYDDFEPEDEFGIIEPDDE
jgi:hypothetical protein